MVADVIGGAMMATGGGMLSVSSITLARLQRRWRSPREFGAGLASALADTITAPIPADDQALLDRLA